MRALASMSTDPRYLDDPPPSTHVDGVVDTTPPTAHADVPIHFRGAPIALITAGLMALAFMGFAGLAKL